MDMDIENHKYKLRLVSFYDEVVMDVVHIYFEREVLDKTTLILFLDQNKHTLFHKYISTIPCCACVQMSLAAPGKHNQLSESQFKLLYDCNGNAEQDHEKKRNGKYDQHCICKISHRSSVAVLDMDITLICIIKACCTHSFPGNPRWLEEIKNIRNAISHIGESANITEQDFNDKWEKLELSVLEIARVTGHSYENSVKKRISSLKEQHKKMDNLTDAITMCNEISENKILEALRNFGVKIDNLSVQIKNAEFSSMDDSVMLGADSKEQHVEESHDAQSIQCSTDMKCYVTWKFATPGHWNVTEMVEKLAQISAVLDFKVVFVHEGSLVVRTSAAIDLLYDKTTFITTISKFVQRLLKECEIDFSMKDEVEVDIIIFYNRRNDAEYISVTCSACEDKESRLCEKETEITRLKNDLNFQLERAYDKAKYDMSHIGLSSLEKSLSMDKPLDDFLANWENEEVTKFIEGSYSEYSSIEPVSTATTDSDKSLQSLEHEQNEEVTSPGVDELRSSSDSPKDKKLELPMFSKLSSFDINCEQYLSITGLAITSKNQIIISNICTNRLLMFTETGKYMNDCLLIDNPWGLSVSYAFESKHQSGLNQLTDTGVVTLPDELCYQYVTINEEGMTPGRAVYANVRCLGIKLTEEKVLVGGNDSIHVFSRTDEYLFAVMTNYAALQIDICITRSERHIHLGSTDSQDEIGPNFKEVLVVLTEDDTLFCTELCINTANKSEEPSVKLRRYIVSWLSLKNDDILSPESFPLSAMAVGRHNEIYVSSKSLDNIYKFCSIGCTDDFTRILGATNDIRNPSAICFSDNYETLLVATKDGRQVVIYRNNEYM